MKSINRILPTIFLSFIICISASSCAGHPPNSSTTAELTSATEGTSAAKSEIQFEKHTGPYAEILNACAEFEQSDFEVSDEALFGDSLLANKNDYTYNFGDAPLTYAYYDINKDGIMELLIGADSYNLIGVYILQDNKPISVMQVENRHNLCLLMGENDNPVIGHSWGHTEVGADFFYAVDKNGKLKVLDKLYTNGLDRTNYNAETGEGLRFFRAKEVNGKQVDITEEEYLALLRKYGSRGYGAIILESDIKEIKLDWKPVVNLSVD